MAWQARASRLVGRVNECELLGRLAHEVVAQRAGRVALIVGEAGVGKSRLVREVTARAGDAGLMVLAGRAVPDGEAYRPLVEALTAALRTRALPREAELRPYLPTLAGILPDVPTEAATDTRGGVVLAEGILRLIAALAAGRGAMLVLEDLHWVDPDTLDVLAHLAQAGGAPTLLVGTMRDDVAASAQLDDLLLASRAHVVSVPRLDDAGVRGLVEACLSARPSDELVDFVVEYADGLPFLVEELLTGLASVGTLEPDGRLVGPLTPSVPRTFAATVRRRLEVLDGSARRVVEAAAVLGRRFYWLLLPEVTELSGRVVLSGLRQAVHGGLVIADAGDTFRFRHALTCDAVRDQLLPPEHRALARTSAAVVELRQPEACELAAGLWMVAQDDIRAAGLYVRAGRQAHQRGALQTADLLLTRASKLAANAPAVRRSAQTVLLDVLAHSGDTDRALVLGERLLDKGGSPVRLTLARVAADAARWDLAAGWLSSLPTEAEPRAGVLAARLAHARGQPEEARQRAEKALPAAHHSGLASVACEALGVIGRAARLSDLAAAREAFAAAEQLAVERGLPIERVSALHELGTIDMLEDGETGRLEQARHLAVDAGLLGLAATLEVQLAAGLSHREPQETLRYAVSSASLARRLRMDQLCATALFFEAFAHAHRQDYPAMERCVQDASALAPNDLDVNAGVWGAVRAHVALLDDHRPALAVCLDTAMDFLRRSATTTPAPTRRLWALVRTLDDRDGEAARTETQPSTVNWENRALLGYAEAVAAGRRGCPREAEDHLACADAKLAANPWWRHRVRLLVADDALTDHWGDPAAWAREALPVFSSLKHERLAAARCRKVLARAGERVPRAGRGDSMVPDDLRARGVTSRETDVLFLVAEGLTNRQIAERLVLSPRTVETHIKNLLAKTHADGRTSLARIAMGVSGDPRSISEPVPGDRWGFPTRSPKSVGASS